MHGSRAEVLQVEQRDQVGWITLDRPQAINSINDALRDALPRALRALDEDRNIRAIVVRGAGPRGFCSGADIKEFRQPESLLAARDRQVRSHWIESFSAARNLLIASVHGFCLGGGLEIALACDIRIAAPDAVFGLPETGLGQIPGAGGTQRLPRVVGLGRALDLLITGDRICAAEAYRIGLVSRLAATNDTLSSETADLAKRIAARPPLALACVKEAAQASFDLSLREGLRLETDLITLLRSTDDCHEAAVAFREKRAPQFKGQ